MKPKLEPKQITDSKNQIELELKRTRRELDHTKNALKHQVARCRHLASAFSKKLAEKDMELKSCRETREKQLSAVIRALLVLESRLRKEQKSIRIMLAERDEIIKSQHEEIVRLEDGHDPDWASKLAARDEEINRLRNLCQPSTNSSEEIESAAKSVIELSGQISSLDEAYYKDEIKDIKDHDLFIQTSNLKIKMFQSLINKDDSKEKSVLKALLLEKEALIKQQQAEIDRLLSITETEKTNDSKETNLIKVDEKCEEEAPNTECYAKPDLISSLCIENQDEKESSTESVTEVTCQPDSLSSDAASTRACLGDNDVESLCNCTITPPVIRGGLSIHDRSAFSPVPRSSQKYESDQHPSVFNISVPDAFKSDYIGSRFESLNIQEPNSSYNSSNARPSSSNRVAMRSFDINYQDNPVLQCVNQILLKDPDDILEDQRTHKPLFPSIESPFVEVDDSDQPFWLSNCVEEETVTDTSTQTLELSPEPALATSSPLEKSNIVPESEPLKTNKLSLSKLIELHNAARKLFPSKRDQNSRKSVSMNDLHSALSKRSNSSDPAKFKKSSSKKIDYDKESKSANSSFQNTKTVLPPQPVYIDRTKLDIISKPSPLPFGNTQGTESDQDNDLYVISNSALDDEILQKLKGKNLKSFEIKLHRLAGEAMMQQQGRRQHCNAPDNKLHPSHKPALNKAMLNNINLLEAAAMLRQLRETSDPHRKADGKQPISHSMSQKARLRVAASVAQLLAQAREQQLRAQAELHIKAQIEHQKIQMEHQQKSPFGSHSKAQSNHHQQRVHELNMKAQTSGLSTEQPCSSTQPPPITSQPPPLPMHPPPPLSPRDSPTNESEDKLGSENKETMSVKDNLNSTSSSHNKDGDTSSSSSSEKSPGTYDNFLEATGLSQKSIMTPSRLLNNHRSVVKPKDVKLRNKVRNAAIFERSIPSQVVGPTIKYWTEPYL